MFCRLLCKKNKFRFDHAIQGTLIIVQYKDNKLAKPSKYYIIIQYSLNITFLLIEFFNYRVSFVKVSKGKLKNLRMENCVIYMLPKLVLLIIKFLNFVILRLKINKTR